MLTLSAKPIGANLTRATAPIPADGCTTPIRPLGRAGIAPVRLLALNGIGRESPSRNTVETRVRLLRLSQPTPSSPAQRSENR